MTFKVLKMLAIAVAACTGTLESKGQEVRFFERDGVTYRETRQHRERPIVETQIQQQQRTLYREQWRTDFRDVVRTRQVPVTVYRRESYWQGRYNPFVQPQLAERMVPYTRWETRHETIRQPYARRELIPITQTVQVPVLTRRVIREEQINRVAVDDLPRKGPLGPADRPQVARQPSNTGWRPATSKLR